MIYLYVLLVIGLLILVHELGHLFAARLVSIPVKTFSIGFGPRLTGFIRRGTDYRLAVIPLGGYIEPALASEEELYAIPLFHRIIFTLGGVAANIALAVVLLCLFKMLSRDVSFLSALLWAGKNCVSLMLQIFAALPSIFTQSGDLVGIIGIVHQGGALMDGGYLQLLAFAGILSLNLAAINLLPLPVFDGGRVLLFILEKAVPPIRKASARLAVAGWMVIIGLTLLATSNDLARIIT